MISNPILYLTSHLVPSHPGMEYVPVPVTGYFLHRAGNTEGGIEIKHQHKINWRNCQIYDNSVMDWKDYISLECSDVDIDTIHINAWS